MTRIIIIIIIKRNT